MGKTLRKIEFLRDFVQKGAAIKCSLHKNRRESLALFALKPAVRCGIL